MANRRDLLKAGAMLPAASLAAAPLRARWSGRAGAGARAPRIRRAVRRSAAIADHVERAWHPALADRRRPDVALVRRARSGMARSADGARRRNARGRSLRARDVRARSRGACRLSRRARPRRGRPHHASASPPRPARRRFSPLPAAWESALATALTDARSARRRRRAPTSSPAALRSRCVACRSIR